MIMVWRQHGGFYYTVTGGHSHRIWRRRHIFLLKVYILWQVYSVTCHLNQTVRDQFCTMFSAKWVESPLKKDSNLFYMTQRVPRCKHTPLRLHKTNILKMYDAKVAVSSEIHTKHINAMWAPYIIPYDVKPGGTLVSTKIHRPEIF
jgi:hypothetical protein